MHKEKVDCMNEKLLIAAAAAASATWTHGDSLFRARVAWETKFGGSSVEGPNLVDNKDAAASSASLWITALILPLQKQTRRCEEDEGALNILFATAPVSCRQYHCG